VICLRGVMPPQNRRNLGDCRSESNHPPARPVRNVSAGLQDSTTSALSSPLPISPAFIAGESILAGYRCGRSFQFRVRGFHATSWEIRKSDRRRQDNEATIDPIVQQVQLCDYSPCEIVSARTRIRC